MKKNKIQRDMDVFECACFVFFFLYCGLPIVFFFFFSSRRRHTRCGRDWSSDVCSSDLLSALGPLSRAVAERVVHASADPAYAGDLVLDEAALEAGLGALRAEAPVVVDASMVGAAITTRETVCALGLAAAPGAPGPGSGQAGPGGGADLCGGTRAAAGIRAAVE